MTRDAAVDRLVASEGHFERQVTDTPLRCVSNEASPILWSVGEGSDARDRDLALRRAEELRSLAERRGAPFPEPMERFDYSSRRSGPPHIYKSRDDLGENAPVVPADFDFSRYWLVRAELPSSGWRTYCPEPRDAYMTMTEEELERQRRESAVEHAREVARREGPATRLASAELRYTYQGELLVITPSVREEHDPETDCTRRQIREPVLVPIPHTRVDWLVTSSSND